jgi:hypothetical protein
MADLLVHGGGSVYLVRTVSPFGAAWVDEHIPADAMWFGGAVVVEHRYVADLLYGAADDGLCIGRDA